MLAIHLCIASNEETLAIYLLKTLLLTAVKPGEPPIYNEEYWTHCILCSVGRKSDLDWFRKEQSGC